MTESDDPVTIGLGIGSAFLTKKLTAGKAGEMPSLEAGVPKKTAEPLSQLSEAAKKNRRLAASFLTKEWSKPKLGAAQMTGGANVLGL